MKNLTTLEIQRATGDWSQGEVNRYAAMIPAWLRTAIEQANAPRKSIKMEMFLKGTNSRMWPGSAFTTAFPGLEFMPQATQRNFNRLKDDPRLAGFTLVGGTALALQIGHRVSEDLDFNRPRSQIDFLKSAAKVAVSEKGFNVLGIDGLFVMKSIVVYDRVKSRDIFDLMVLTRDHGYTLENIFAAIDAYQPIRNKDPEHFKSVVTGVIPFDKNDEGFSSIHLNVKMGDVYKYFKKLIDDYEINAVKNLR